MGGLYAVNSTNEAAISSHGRLGKCMPLSFHAAKQGLAPLRRQRPVFPSSEPPVTPGDVPASLQDIQIVMPLASVLPDLAQNQEGRKYITSKLTAGPAPARATTGSAHH